MTLSWFNKLQIISWRSWYLRQSPRIEIRSNPHCGSLCFLCFAPCGQTPCGNLKVVIDALACWFSSTILTKWEGLVSQQLCEGHHTIRHQSSSAKSHHSSLNKQQDKFNEKRQWLDQGQINYMAFSKTWGQAGAQEAPESLDGRTGSCGGSSCAGASPVGIAPPVVRASPLLPACNT